MKPTLTKIRKLIERLDNDVQEDVWYDSAHEPNYPHDPQTEIIQRIWRTPKRLLKMLDRVSLTEEQADALLHLRIHLLYSFPESDLYRDYVEDGLDPAKYNIALGAINKLLGDD